MRVGGFPVLEMGTAGAEVGIADKGGNAMFASGNRSICK
jgi:hypothetical protein